MNLISLYFTLALVTLAIYYMYIYFKIDKSVTTLLYVILLLTFAVLSIYPFSIPLIFLGFGLLIATLVYSMKYDPGFYKRWRENQEIKSKGMMVIGILLGVFLIISAVYFL